MSQEITFVPLELITSVFFVHRRRYDEPHIRSLQDLLQADDDFNLEPVVLLETKPQQYAIVSGYHRVEAYRRADRLEIPAIVIQDEREATIIASRDNAIGVSPLSVDERRAIAAELLHRGFDKSEIAQHLRVSPHWVWRVQKELEAGEHIPQGPPPTVELTQPTRKPKSPRSSRKDFLEAADGLVTDEQEVFPPLVDWQVVFERLTQRSLFLIRQLEDYSKAIREVTVAFSRERNREPAIVRYKHLKPVLQTIVNRFRDVYKQLQDLHQKLDRAD